jgi:plasmid maintenance system antidote protein VapI
MNSGVAESQTLLASKLNIHASQLNRLIRVVRMKEESTEAPTLDMIVDLSEQFGYSCEWIMTKKGSMKLIESESQKLKRLEKQMI